MKKSLIALAAFAYVGTAFADVSITGLLNSGYLARNEATGMNRSGFGVEKSEIYFTVKEDLGSNQNIIAMLSIGGLDRSMAQDPKTTTASTGVTGRDASIAYTNSALGRIEIGNTTPKNYFATIATAGAPVIDFDEKLFETRTSNDYISYKVPIGPVVVIATHNEGRSGLGIGMGDKAPITVAGVFNNYQTNNTLTALYKQGPLVAALSYRQYNFQKTSVTTPDVYLGTRNSIINAQLSYDLMVAKVGAGYQRSKGSSNVQVDDYLVGFSVPVGALTFGGTVAGSRASNVPNTSAIIPTWNLMNYQGTKTGYSLGASYSFTKTTALVAKFAAWKYSGYTQYERDAAANANASAGTAVIGAGKLGDGLATERSVVLSHLF
jgi:Gram-negative porin